ncbi:MAG: hypothetical protein CMO55_20185 [Verrucomicrobiales bacterium]|nr:hypothetical protein [Verrucomicrobiales bacterium]
MPKSEILERESVEYFVSLVQLFGLPKSIGQIYGLLFVSKAPLAMDDIMSRLGISKGSASQGLSLLKSLGAVTSIEIPGERRDHYEADLNVSRIVNHFVENRLQDRLDHAETRIKSMVKLARGIEKDSDSDSETNLLHRIQALQKWQKRGKNLIPLILRWLKR